MTNNKPNVILLIEGYIQPHQTKNKLRDLDLWPYLGEIYNNSDYTNYNENSKSKLDCFDEPTLHISVEVEDAEYGYKANIQSCTFGFYTAKEAWDTVASWVKNVEDYNELILDYLLDVRVLDKDNTLIVYKLGSDASKCNSIQRLYSYEEGY